MSAHDWYAHARLVSRKADDYEARLAAAVEARDHDLVDGVLEELAHDRSVTVARLEEILGRQRSYLERTRADLIEALRNRARNDILNADRHDHQEQYEP